MPVILKIVGCIVWTVTIIFIINEIRKVCIGENDDRNGWVTAYRVIMNFMYIFIGIGGGMLFHVVANLLTK